jgi:hypothetical protein
VYAGELKGYVRTTSGEPVTDVMVYSKGEALTATDTSYPFTFTDDTGFFKITHPGKVLFINHTGFMPIFIKLSDNSEFVQVRLETISSKAIRLEMCDKCTCSQIRLGRKLQFPIPSDVEITLFKGADSQESIINYAFGELRILWGAMASSGMPEEEWIMESVQIETSVIISGKYQWVSYKGILPSGRRWRYVGAIREQVKYYGVTEQSASKLDKFIDGACFQEGSTK